MIQTHISYPEQLGQLMQVVSNLVENALRYSLMNIQQAKVTIIAGMNLKTGRAFLDIIDQGEGISDDKVEKIFEPFFTTSPTGTGLGLYVSKELCEANQASLDYIPVPSGGSCFRLTFARDEM